MLGYIITPDHNINPKNHAIQNFDVLQKTHLNIYVIENDTILYKNNIFKNACIHNHDVVLEWFIKSGYDYFFNDYHDNEIYKAFMNNSIQVLEWFLRSNLDLKYDSKEIIKNLAFNNDIFMLEWFYNSKYNFIMTKDAIIGACQNSHVNVLEWLKSKNFIKNKAYGVLQATIYGNYEILEWYKKNNFKIIYTRYYVRNSGCIQCLNFWIEIVNIKKIIMWLSPVYFDSYLSRDTVKWLNPRMFIKTLKFKTKNKYFKGYKKN